MKRRGSSQRERVFVPIHQAQIQSMIAFGFALLLAAGALVFGRFTGFITKGAEGTYEVTNAGMMFGYYILMLGTAVIIVGAIAFIAYQALSERVIGLNTESVKQPLPAQQPAPSHQRDKPRPSGPKPPRDNGHPKKKRERGDKKPPNGKPDAKKDGKAGQGQPPRETESSSTPTAATKPVAPPPASNGTGEAGDQGRGGEGLSDDAPRPTGEQTS